jgi:hypothetical protein
VRFVVAVGTRKGVPVLITPVARRKFDAGGRVVELLQRLGPEGSKVLFNYLEPGEHPNYPEGRKDDTHFSELGARKMAEIVLADIRAMKLGLAGHIAGAGAGGVVGPAAAGVASKRIVVALFFMIVR